MDAWKDGLMVDGYFFSRILTMKKLEPHRVSGFPQSQAVIRKGLEILLFLINRSSNILQWHNILKCACG